MCPNNMTYCFPLQKLRQDMRAGSSLFIICCHYNYKQELRQKCDFEGLAREKATIKYVITYITNIHVTRTRFDLQCSMTSTKPICK